jgi:putative transposase
VIDQNCFYSKNLYNYANYIIRQELINNSKWLRYQDLQKSLKTSDAYKQLKSQPSQCVLQSLDRVWKSYFNSIKDWKQEKSKYLGMPKMPSYKKKDGRYVWFIKNNNAFIEDDGNIYFRVKRLQGYVWKTKAKGKLLCIRFVPLGVNYKMEVVTEIEISDIPDDLISDRVCSIDLGINNFVTLTNNIGLQPIIINGKGMKSCNQFYNKRKSKLQSELKKRNNQDLSNKLEAITFKRNNVTNNYLHNSSKIVVEYCKANNIDTLVCGYNKEWKQNIHICKKVSQSLKGDDVSQIEILDETTFSFVYSGDLNILLKKLSELDVEDIDITKVSLEDIFKSFYTDNKEVK